MSLEGTRTETDTMMMSWVIAIVVCFSAVLVLRPIAVTWGLVDVPSKRKQHSGDIPLIGGIAIYIATLSAVSIYAKTSQIVNLTLVSISLMVFIGALDDKYDLNAKLRLIAQVLVASILTFGTDVQIYSFGNVLGLGEISTGPLSGLVTILAIVAGINAYNMTDGIDGLAGTLSLISLVALSVVVTNEGLLVLITVLSAAILVFLLFNLGVFTKKNKIFMGDAGSMMLGLVIAWLLIVASQGSSKTIEPGYVLWFIAVPLIDMLTVMYRRVRKGKSPMIADREHLHHMFLDMGFNSRQALIFISAISVVFTMVGFILPYYELSERTSLILFVIAFVIYNKILNHRHQLKKFLSR